MRLPQKPAKDNKLLHFLYDTIPGRVVLKGLSSRRLSVLCGKFLDSPYSKALIPAFVKKNHIRLEDFYSSDFRSFNDCFGRKILRSRRPIDKRQDALIAPCDGLLSVYPIKKDMVIPVKQSRYSLRSLFDGDPVWKDYEDGYCMVYRLCVNHYHRYCYLDDGEKGGNYFIPGRLHTVRPIALMREPVFAENCREYTVMHTKKFGKVVQMEVGAMLVGKIANNDGTCKFRRGQEKGRFLYGGSTIIVFLQKDKVHFSKRLLEATEHGKEVPVLMGEMVGIGIS